MLIGLLSDPHANLPAVMTVLSDVEAVRPDLLICLGDFVGYGAHPNEVVAAVREQCDVFLIGNHDLAALGAIDISDFNEYAAAAARWTNAEISAETRGFLESLAPRGAAAGIELAHASIRDPIWEYVMDSESAAASFASAEFSVAAVGHTHIPAVFSHDSRGVGGLRVITPEGHAEVRMIEDLAGQDRRLLLNPGGIGQPRDGDPRASWATWEDDSATFTVRRLEYPVAEAQASIVAAGLPEVLAKRLAEGW